MSKTTNQIAADCGLDSAMTKWLDRILNDQDGRLPSHPLEASAHDIIGALYRRIEKLEEEKHGLMTAINSTGQLLAENIQELGDNCFVQVHEAFTICDKALDAVGAKREEP